MSNARRKQDMRTPPISQLQFLNYLINRLYFRTPGAADGLIDFQIHTRIAFHADHTQENAECLGGLAALADNLTHIVRMHHERQEDTHLIDRTRPLAGLRMADERLHRVFEECLVW